MKLKHYLKGVGIIWLFYLSIYLIFTFITLDFDMGLSYTFIRSLIVFSLLFGIMVGIIHEDHTTENK